MIETMSPEQERDARKRAVASLIDDGLSADRAHDIAGNAEYRMVNGAAQVAFNGGEFTAIGSTNDAGDDSPPPPAYDAAAAGRAAGQAERLRNQPNANAFT